MATRLPSIFDPLAGRPLDMGVLEQAMQDDIERRCLACLDGADDVRTTRFADGDDVPGVGPVPPRRPGPADADFSWEEA